MANNVGLWGAVKCLLGRHVRSRGQARAATEGWTSRCARCAIPMARAHSGGKWTVIKKPLPGDDETYEQAAAAALSEAIARSRSAGFRERREKVAKGIEEAPAT